MCEDFDLGCGDFGGGGDSSGGGIPGEAGAYGVQPPSNPPAYTPPPTDPGGGYYAPPADYGALSYSPPPAGGGSVDAGGGGVGGYTPGNVGSTPFDAGGPAFNSATFDSPAFGTGGSDLASLAGGVPGPAEPPVDFGQMAFTAPTPPAAPAPFVFNQEGLTSQGPAGSGGSPDAARLNASPALAAAQTGAPPPVAASGGTMPGGIGAVGALGAPGGGDLSASDPNKNFAQWSADGQRFLGNPETAPGLPGVGSSSSGSSGSSGNNSGGFSDAFGIKNPLGTAIAAGGLANAIYQGQAQSKALQSNGQSPGANLVELAGPAMAHGREITDQGAGLVTQGNADLRARAASTDPNATTLMDRGTGLTGYVGTGTLPPAVQAQLDQAKSDARTGIISKYATRGMPTDPAHNSSLRMELQDLDRRTVTEGEKLAAGLATTGNAITGAGANLNQTSGAQQLSAAQLGSNLVNSGVAESGLAGTTFSTLAKLDQDQADRTSKAIAAMAAALSGQSVSNNANNLARTV